MTGLWLCGLAATASGASLDRALSEALSAAELEGAVVSLVVEGDGGDVLVEHRGHTRAVPASTVKWLTAVTAADQLGLEWRYGTQLVAAGWLEGDTLHGTVGVVGSGDPSLGREAPAVWISQAVDALTQLGVQRIDGDVLADASVFGDPMLGAGWMWDDLGFGFSAPFAGVNLGGNLAWVEVEDVCVSAGGVGTPLVDPPRCVARALSAGLAAAGIDVTGEARAARVPDDHIVLRTESSEPLRVLLAHTLEVSDNLYAECIARTLTPGGRFGDARASVLDVATRAGVAADRLRLADGSGLSRYSLVAASDLVAVTTWAVAQPFGPELIDMLPVAGRTGTLEHRLVGTVAEGRVRGKTGSMSGVRNLVGQIEDADGRSLTFAMLITGFVGPQAAAIAIQDRALQILAISRRGRVRGRDLRALAGADG